MKNPLVEKVENIFEQLGFRGAILLQESYDEQSFGNALALYRIGNLYLRFLRDRDDDTVDFLNLFENKELYTFDDISLLMGWMTLEEMIKEFQKTSFDEPPTGPIPLCDAMCLIKQHLDILKRMFSPDEVDETLQKLEEISKKRVNAFFPD